MGTNVIFITDVLFLIKIMYFFCQYCGHKHYGDTSTLVEIKSAPIPARADGVNAETVKQHKKYKCYNCGRSSFRLIQLEEEKVVKKEKVDILPPEEDDYLKGFEKDILKSIRTKK